MKKYNKIRLEFNEGRIQGKTRNSWRENAKDLPCQQTCKDGGYNKHYYEIELNNGKIAKFRLDIGEYGERILESDIEEFINKLN